MTRHRSTIRWLYICGGGGAALALIFAGMWRSTGHILSDPRVPAQYDELAVADPDYRYIFQFASEVTRFRDSFKWWTERWINFTVHWRPLSSQVFWLQYKCIGPDNLERWIWVNLVSNAAVVALLVLLVREVTGKVWYGVLAAVLFGGWRPVSIEYLPLWAGWTPASLALTMPKDQPELFLTACVLLGMILAARRRWVGALLCIAAAVCFKESGWMGFPLLLVAVAMKDGLVGLRRIPWWAWVTAVALGTGLLVLRWVSLPGHFMGMATTANIAWVSRGLIAAQGPWVMAMLPPYVGPGVLATSLLALVVLRDRIRSIWLPVLVLAAIAVAGALTAVVAETSLATGLLMLLGPNMHGQFAMAAFAWLAFAWALATDSDLRLWGACAVVAVLIATIPWMSATQAGHHTLYMQYAFQAVLVALAWVAVGKRLRGAALAWFSRRRETAV